MTQKLFAVCSASLLFLQVANGGQCSYSFSPGSAAPPAKGTNSNFSVTTGNSCSWTAASTNSWVHPTGSGTGSGAVTYTVDQNLSTNARAGAITVGGQTFVINQAAAPLPIGPALDDTNLIWTTSTNYPWAGTNPPAPSFDGTGSAVSGNRFVPNSASWLQTTVTGPGVLSFWWKVDSDVTPPPPDPPYSYDYLEFVIDETSQNMIMGQVDWNYQSYVIPAGTHVLQWQYVKDGQYNTGSDQGWLDQVIYTTNAPIALQESLNTCGLNWTTGGNTNQTFWSGETNATHDGKSAAQSGAVYYGQESWMQTVVSGITNLSFWWKVSSQTNYDFLEFYTNSILAKRISGEVNWQSNFFRLPSSTNTLKWRYVKTNFNFVAQGQNCGWVDQVTASPSFKAFPYTLRGVSPTPSGAQITIDGESGCNCQVQVSSDLVQWAPLSNFTLVNGSYTILDPAAATSPVRYYRTLSP
jgi:hypothetical protein